MTANLLRHRTRNPLGVAQTTIIIGLLLSPIFFKVFGNYAARAATINEYQTGRSFILSKVDAAVEKNDVSTLLHLHRKYAGCVTDTNFMGELKEALAKATARRTLAEVLVTPAMCRLSQPLLIELLSAAPDSSVCMASKCESVLSGLPHACTIASRCARNKSCSGDSRGCRP